MLDIPVEHFLAHIIKTFGILFFLTHDKFPEKRHPTILVGCDVAKDTVLLLVGTSKTTKTRRHINLNHFDIKTLVLSGPRECQSLQYPTAFNCNQVVELPFGELCKKIKDKDVKRLDTIDISIMKKVYDGIQISSVIDPYTKNLIKQHYQNNNQPVS